MTREPIYQAVYQFFANLTAGNAPLFRTSTRHTVSWDKLAPEETPALLFKQHGEEARRRTGFPTIWTLRPVLMLYAHTGAQSDPSIIPGQILNPLLDAIEQALDVLDPKTGKCTLNGLVSHCAIVGTIDMIEGTLGNEAVAVIPLEILTSP